MRLGKYIPEPVKKIIVNSALITLYLRKIMIVAFPRAIDIELTNRCNLQCRMCQRNNAIKNLEVGDMDFGLFKQVIDNIASSGIVTEGSRFTLVGLGEPLMYAKLPDAIDYAKRRCPQTPVLLFINGVFLDEAWSRKLCEVLCDEGDRILISLNAGSRESYKWLTGFDKYDLVVNNIKQFLRIRESKGTKKPKVTIQLLKIKRMIPEIEQFETMWKPFTSPDVKLYIRPFIALTLIDSTEFRVKEQPTERYPCQHLWSELTIDKDGNMYACCAGIVFGPKSSLCLGNVHEGSIREIYATRIGSYRERHLKNDYSSLPECLGCEIYAARRNVWIKDRFISKRWW